MDWTEIWNQLPGLMLAFIVTSLIGAGDSARLERRIAELERKIGGRPPYA